LDKGELYQKIFHDDSKLVFEPMGKGKGVDFGFIVSKWLYKSLWKYFVYYNWNL